MGYGHGHVYCHTMSCLVAMAIPISMIKLDTQRITDAVARMFIHERSNGVLREFKLKSTKTC